MLRQRIDHLAEQIDTFRKQKLGLAHTEQAQAAINSEAMVPCAGTPQTLAEPGATGVGGDVAKRSASEPPAPAASGEPQNAASLNSPTKPAKDLTLTGLYNVLQALREGRPLTAKEKQIHSAGLVGVLKTLHDELDDAVLQAYGWADLQAGLAASPNSPEFATARDELLLRLVTLNAQRAAEEARGQVRWLRPAFQNPLLKQELLTHVQQGLEVDLAYKWPIQGDAVPDANDLAANAPMATATSRCTRVRAHPALASDLA